MTLNDRFNIPPHQRPFDYAAKNFDQLQPDLVSMARIWAFHEVGAAMAHQVNDPLTALLFYLHEIKENGEHSSETEVAPGSIRQMVEMALRETERVCDILERLGHTFETPANTENAIARGRDASDWWTRSTARAAHGGVPPPAASGPPQRMLTPREREVLAAITGGASNKEGGYRLGISTRTFEVHRARIMDKLGAKNAADLVRMVLSEGR
jgi:DNA-binding CsgD family transcriptional regulator